MRIDLGCCSSLRRLLAEMSSRAALGKALIVCGCKIEKLFIQTTSLGSVGIWVEHWVPIHKMHKPKGLARFAIRR